MKDKPLKIKFLGKTKHISPTYGDQYGPCWTGHKLTIHQSYSGESSYVEFEQFGTEDDILKYFSGTGKTPQKAVSNLESNLKRLHEKLTTLLDHQPSNKIWVMNAKSESYDYYPGCASWNHQPTQEEIDRVRLELDSSEVDPDYNDEPDFVIDGKKYTTYIHEYDIVELDC